jgi:hypothetical protein
MLASLQKGSSLADRMRHSCSLRFAPLMIAGFLLMPTVATAWIEDPNWPESSLAERKVANRFVSSDDWRLKGTLEALNDDDVRVVGLAIDMLGTLRSRIGVEQIVKRLGDDPDLTKEPSVTLAVANTFGAVQTDPHTEVEFLIKTYEDSGNPDVRKAAVQALANFGDGAKSAVDSLMRCRDREQYQLVFECEQALTAIRVGDDASLNRFLADLDSVKDPSAMGYEFMLCSWYWNSADIFRAVADEAKPRVSDQLDARLSKTNNSTAASASLQAWAALNYYAPKHLGHLIDLLKEDDSNDNSWVAYNIGLAAEQLADHANRELVTKTLLSRLAALAKSRQQPSNAQPFTMNPYLFALLQLGAMSEDAKQVASGLLADKSVSGRGSTFAATESNRKVVVESIPPDAILNLPDAPGCLELRALARRYPKQALNVMATWLQSLPPYVSDDAKYCVALARVELQSETDEDIDILFSRPIQSRRVFANVPSVLELILTSEKAKDLVIKRIPRFFDQYIQEYARGNCQSVVEDTNLWRVIALMGLYGQEVWAVAPAGKPVQAALLRLLSEKCPDAPLDNNQRKEVATALSWLGKLPFQQAVSLLAVGFQSPEAIPDMRFWTLFLSGGDAKTGLAARWLNGGATDLPELTIVDAVDLLQVFESVLAGEPGSTIRSAVLSKLLQVVKNTNWTPHEVEELKNLRVFVLKDNTNENRRQKQLAADVVGGIDYTLDSLVDRI